MNRQRTLGMVATGAAAAAIASFVLVGEMPDTPPAATTCTVSWAAGPCEAAIAFSAGDVTCTPGTIVTLPVEVALELDGTGGTGGAHPERGPLDASFIPINDTTRVIDCATMTRPGKVMTVVPLAKYGIDIGNGTLCPPIVVAGLIPPGCE